MSSCTQQDGHMPSTSTSRRRLRRSASSAVLDQLRSFSLLSGGVAVGDLAGVSDSGYCYHCSEEAEVVPAPHQVSQVATVVPEAPRPTAPVAGEDVSTAAPTATLSVPAATAAAAAETESRSERTVKEAGAEEQDSRSISLDVAYAMVQRRRPSQSPSAPTATTAAASWPQKNKDLAAKAPKGGRGPTAEDALAPEGKAELNARVELFIRQFREELKLQRLNSIDNYTHALGRGGDVAPEHD